MTLLMEHPSYQLEVEKQDEILRQKRQECNLSILNDNANALVPMEGVAEQSGCEALWDGILCWPNTAPDTLANATCPSYIIGFTDKAKAFKYCTADSTWYVRPQTNTPWSNYSLCTTNPYATINIMDSIHNASVSHQWLPFVKIVSQVGYGISILTLAVAFLVLLLSRRLKCPRNTLHMHLFVSFMLRAFMALLKDSLFVQGVGLPSDVTVTEGQLQFVPDKKNWGCKIVTSLWQFCFMVNYSWILMEGLYLHNLIFMALFTDSSAITLYVLFGWGLPVVVVVPWIILRATLEDTLCWTTNQIKELYLIIRLPIIASVLVNFVLFLNIVRVLLLKFKASVYVARRNARYGKWARSTLVLIPLFGVHYSLSLGMSYWLDPSFEMLWIFFDQLFASFQGFLVSLLYCLLNGEVRAELARVCCTIRGRARCTASNEEAGVTSLPMLSRLHLARSAAGPSFQEMHHGIGNGHVTGTQQHVRPTFAYKITPPTPQLYMNNDNIND